MLQTGIGQDILSSAMIRAYAASKDKQLKKVSDELIEEYLKRFSQNRRYSLADQLIAGLVSKYPKNIDREEIHLKIKVINNLYSTQVVATEKMATHILRLKVDAMLSEGSVKVVNLMAQLALAKDATRHFYSFATKYCNWHNESCYPIYDRYVVKTLVAYRAQDKYHDFRQCRLREYDYFKHTIEAFIRFYHLTSPSFKNIDKFLWLYGKELSGISIE